MQNTALDWLIKFVQNRQKKRKIATNLMKTIKTIKA